VAEWSNVPDSKSGVVATLPRVRIPPPPPVKNPALVCHCGVFYVEPCAAWSALDNRSWSFSMKSFVLLTAWVWVMCLSGCTVLAIADAAGSAVVYGVKTTVNVLDAVTPDIVNKKK